MIIGSANARQNVRQNALDLAALNAFQSSRSGARHFLYLSLSANPALFTFRPDQYSRAATFSLPFKDCSERLNSRASELPAALPATTLRVLIVIPSILPPSIDTPFGRTGEQKATNKPTNKPDMNAARISTVC